MREEDYHFIDLKKCKFGIITCSIEELIKHDIRFCMLGEYNHVEERIGEILSLSVFDDDENVYPNMFDCDVPIPVKFVDILEENDERLICLKKEIKNTQDAYKKKLERVTLQLSKTTRQKKKSMLENFTIKELEVEIKSREGII